MFSLHLMATYSTLYSAQPWCPRCVPHSRRSHYSKLQFNLSCSQFSKIYATAWQIAKKDNRHPVFLHVTDYSFILDYERGTLQHNTFFSRFLHNVTLLSKYQHLYNILCTVNTQHTLRQDAIITVRFYLATCFGRKQPSSGQLRTVLRYSKNSTQWDPIAKYRASLSLEAPNYCL